MQADVLGQHPEALQVKSMAFWRWHPYLVCVSPPGLPWAGDGQTSQLGETPARASPEFATQSSWDAFVLLEPDFLAWDSGSLLMKPVCRPPFLHLSKGYVISTCFLGLLPGLNGLRVYGKVPLWELQG